MLRTRAKSLGIARPFQSFLFNGRAHPHSPSDRYDHVLSEGSRRSPHRALGAGDAIVPAPPARMRARCRSRVTLPALLIAVVLLGGKLAAVAPFAAQATSTADPPILEMPALTARTLIAYGHSYVVGGHVDYFTPWTTKVARALH